jgi:hypothetical protein
VEIAMNDLDALRARLETLERQNRWMRRLAVVLILALATAALTAANQKVEPKSFIVQDDQGKERGRLSMGKDGPVFQYTDENGKMRGGLEMTRDGIALRFLDEQGRLHTGLSVEREGLAIVSSDRNGKLLVGTNGIQNNSGVLLVPEKEKTK